MPAISPAQHGHQPEIESTETVGLVLFDACSTRTLGRAMNAPLKPPRTKAIPIKKKIVNMFLYDGIALPPAPPAEVSPNEQTDPQLRSKKAGYVTSSACNGRELQRSRSWFERQAPPSPPNDAEPKVDELGGGAHASSTTSPFTIRTIPTTRYPGVPRRNAKGGLGLVNLPGV
eukprot:1107340-Rhodomonas_salina.3